MKGVGFEDGGCEQILNFPNSWEGRFCSGEEGGFNLGGWGSREDFSLGKIGGFALGGGGGGCSLLVLWERSQTFSCIDQ